jgi:anaerobic selenocysteine-containing dehydrogenase
VAPTLLPDGVWRIAPPEMVARLRAHAEPAEGLVLVNRRDVRRLNSLTYAGDSEAQVRVHPDDAAGLDGSVTVTSAHGSITGSVVLDPTMRPGTVSVNHGRAGSDVARLTSATVDVDPLTGMPLASGLLVTLSPAQPG